MIFLDFSVKMQFSELYTYKTNDVHLSFLLKKKHTKKIPKLNNYKIHQIYIS